MIRLVIQTIIHFRGLLLPVALGVAVAAAVIVGALIVGDSMRGSLRHMALDRIGDIEQVMIAPRWFSPSILPKHNGDAAYVPLVLVQQATAQFEVRDGEKKTVHRANEMTLYGVDEDFWKLGNLPSQLLAEKEFPKGEKVLLNQTLAEALHVSVGDLITLRLSANPLVPAESALGKQEQDTYVLPRWKVVAILPDEGLARFSLRSDQRPTMNAFVDKAAIQNALEIDDKVNMVVSPVRSHQGNEQKVAPELLSQLHPGLQDLGMSFERVRVPENSDDPAVLEYDHLTSDQMLLPDGLVEALMNSTKKFDPKTVLTYLANGIEKVGRNESANSPKSSVPYSTISAVDWDTIRDLLSQSESLPPGLKNREPEGNWVVIHQWLADELSIQIGDKLKIDYFLPETVEGEEIEKSFQVDVVAIAPLTSPQTGYVRNKKAKFDLPATPFNDPNWTPVVPGITDQDSISKWDTPFPLKRSIDSRDDDYWNDHRLTPKLFISYARGKELFGSRFGNATSLRFDRLNKEQREELHLQIEKTVVEEMGSLGWRELPIRQQQLARSSGTTPFDALFLSLSFFLIAAALLLVALLFRLSIERRANHWGLLAATGWSRKGVRRLLLLEGGVLAAFGATIGSGLGMGYAFVMVELLKSWWVGAITVSFLNFYMTPKSLLLGWTVSWFAAWVTIFFAARKMERVSIATMLKGRLEDSPFTSKASRWSIYVGVAFGILGIVTLSLGGVLQGQAQAGAFVGGGMSILLAGLASMWGKLTSRKSQSSDLPTTAELASSNAKRAPTRSLLAIALVAIASFLILSMSLFQATPTGPGLGGFYWIGKSSSPIYIELGNPEARKENLGVRGDIWTDVEVVSMRVRGGDDASCNNLYQASEPQVLGISPRIAKMDEDANGRSRFAWFQTKARERNTSPWNALEGSGLGSKESPIPVILDQNTALWALHLGGYVGEIFQFEFNRRPVYFQTVGVLQNTILQGSLIIGEENFQRLFPEITGYQSFLVRMPESKIAQASDFQVLVENGWEEQGLSLVRSSDVLSQLLAVQNTYLSAFQILGAMGLLLGTIGLAVSQIRGALERRSELAAMRAIGFTKERLTWLLTLENIWQLMRGMLIGGAAAAVATLPALVAGQPFAGFASPLTMLGWILGVGLCTSWIAAKLAMRWPLVASLRSDT